MGTLGVQIPGPAQIAKQPPARLRGVACQKNLDMEDPEEDDIAVPGAWAGDLRDIPHHLCTTLVSVLGSTICSHLLRDTRTYIHILYAGLWDPRSLASINASMRDDGVDGTRPAIVTRWDAHSKLTRVDPPPKSRRLFPFDVKSRDKQAIGEGNGFRHPPGYHPHGFPPSTHIAACHRR
ncbi:hypothetical protein CSOJ01_11062 [Colletotrichum sojae]|uniref:Uncharacterized protein n=1 Tax=Colletotrichum sojae TaxID=2175907 RepID=A0A8H6IYQ0_9PEZI|nr:hypothetical protein CSOJ01_11062 [Colletotrichum sojae]